MRDSVHCGIQNRVTDSWILSLPFVRISQTKYEGTQELIAKGRSHLAAYQMVVTHIIPMLMLAPTPPNNQAMDIFPSLWDCLEGSRL